MTKSLLWVVGGCCLGALLRATPPEITNVQAAQREGTKLVDITYDAADADGDLLKVRVEISDNDGRVYSVPAFTFTGDIGEGIAPGAGKHIVWDAGTDWDGEYSDQMRVKVFAIDAKGFPGMEWGNEVPPGGFLLGQDGGAEGSGPSRHVNIPWSYWLTKYEVTRQQYCDFLNQAYVSGLVYRNADSSAVYATDKVPVDYACPIDALLCNTGDTCPLRWNVNNFEVVGENGNYPMVVTWYGAMLFCRFYGYDLPTEAEWEKAARGPDNDDENEHLLYPWGNEVSSAYAMTSTGYANLKPVGYYDGNQTPMGPDTVNGYGLYDVIGNVAEWTRSQSDYTIETYPQQESLLAVRNSLYFVSSRITKGCSTNAMYQRSGYKQVWARTSYPSHSDSYFSNALSSGYYLGFRPIRRLDAEEGVVKLAVAENFDTWALKEYGEKTVTTTAGNWKLSTYLYVRDQGIDGSRALYTDSSTLYFPVLADQLCFVRLKAKNTNTSSRTLYVECDLGYAASVSVPANMSEFRTFTLPAKPNGSDYYLYVSNSGVIIDDLELWTVPEEAAVE
ncbi:MAG: formylglycine-generating enzyme family protein [Candidatus Spyradenecus sp.]